MVKLIAMDVDETLVPAGGTALDPEYFEVFEELMKKGVKVVVASGRHYVSVRKLFAPVIDKIDVISQGGGVILCNGEEEVMKPIPTEWVKNLWKEISAYQETEVNIAALTARSCFVPSLGNKMTDLLISSYRYELTPTGGWDILPEEDYSMITVYHPTDIKAFWNSSQIIESWSDKMVFAVSGQYFTDIHIPGSDKGSSLLKLCAKLGIDPADTIAFGDNNNDITMIQNAGLGYVVEDGVTEAKAVADKIIPGCRENGVLTELKRIAAELERSEADCECPLY